MEKLSRGYVLVRVDGEAKGKIGKRWFNSNLCFTNHLVHGCQIIPGQPTDPIKYPMIQQIQQNQDNQTEVVPYVPGYTPKDKDGNPLKPVDPNDPTKGYEVPKSSNRSKSRYTNQLRKRYSKSEDDFRR